jgi:cytoskeletal protein CcmA (bactofilin family)
MNGNLYVDKLLVTKDLSLNGNLYINYQDSSIPPSAIIGGVSTGIFIKDISANSRLFLQGDASLNGKLFVNGDVSMNGNLNVNGSLTAKTQLNPDNSTLVATTAFVKNQGYAALSGAEFTGDVKLDRRLFVQQDASFNGNLYVDKGAKIMGEMIVSDRLDISGSIIAHTNVNVYGIINQYTTTLDEGYKVNYDTQVYIEQLQQQVATLHQQMANVLQILTNNNIH